MTTKCGWMGPHESKFLFRQMHTQDKTSRKLTFTWMYLLFSFLRRFWNYCKWLSWFGVFSCWQSISAISRFSWLHCLGWDGGSIKAPSRAAFLDRTCEGLNCCVHWFQRRDMRVTIVVCIFKAVAKCQHDICDSRPGLSPADSSL